MKIGIPAEWTDMIADAERCLPEILARTREVRSVRRGILDAMTDDQITEQIALFSGWR